MRKEVPRLHKAGLTMSTTKCLLCEREGEKRSYYYPDTFEEAEVPLCQFHYASYMAHGINRLDKIMAKKRSEVGQSG